MNVTFDEIVTAAWVHKIGLFAKRAGVEQLVNNLSESSFNYTKGFIQTFHDIFPKEIDLSKVISLASEYNQKKDLESSIISFSDNLSCGNSITCESSEGDSSLFPMEHLISSLYLEGKDKGSVAYCKLSALEGDAILSSTKSTVSKEDYKSHWNKFIEDFKALKNLPCDKFYQSLDSLFKRYLWCIPIRIQNDKESTISLYQHLKTSAAFAASLYRYVETNNSVSLDSIEKPFVFVSGDLSGIQKYIFDLRVAKFNAKLLRAKSFQLAALGEVVSQYIVKAFNVTEANIITSAGGKFIIVLPAYSDSTVKIQALRADISEYFLKEFAGRLGIIISDGTFAGYEDLTHKNIQKLLNDIGHNGDICKQKKMQVALKKHGAVLAEFYDKLQQYGECTQCGIFPADEVDSTGGESKPICTTCKTLADTGRLLMSASKVYYHSDKLGPFRSIVSISPRDNDKFGYTINEFRSGLPLMYSPYEAPVDKYGDILTFEDIAKRSNGNKKIAMFKADVDNLGLVFSSSLGKSLSLARYSDLSSLMHYFFSSFYSYFIQNKSYEREVKNDDGSITKETVFYRDTIYTVFSGGDDLCLLGAWDSVIHFANDFHKSFNEFSNKNPSITLSAGIALSSSSVPIRDVAESCENLLEESKHRYVDEKNCKNAITLFGNTVTWDGSETSYENCLKNGLKIQSHLDKKELSTGVVYRMLDLGLRAKKGQQGSLRDLVWNSNYRYMIIRNVSKENEDLKKWLLDFGTNPVKMINTRIAVSYALYTQRTK